MTHKQSKLVLVAGGIITNASGSIVIVNQRHDSWSFPKGHVDAGEDLLTTAKREIYEETGISDPAYVKKLGTYRRPRIGKDGKGENMSEIRQMTLFHFTSSEKTLSPLDPDNPEARWVTIAEALSLLTHPKDRAFLRKVKDKL